MKVATASVKLAEPNVEMKTASIVLDSILSETEDEEKPRNLAVNATVQVTRSRAGTFRKLMTSSAAEGKKL